MLKSDVMEAPWGAILTRHALKRLRQRGIPPDAIAAALDYGLMRKGPGGVMRFFFGRRHARRARSEGVNIDVRALLVVVADAAGIVITAYWNG